ncbi:MAG: hypothetical protein NT171_09315, partial [Planctomycetota bacterium]|nr:hypothetical protein [Planctomycetota bacterium]
IIIISILAAIAVPAVMRAVATANNARIKTEIDMLHMAIMQYKNEYGSFPACIDPQGAAGNAAQSTVNKHLRRIFPRILDGNLPDKTQSPNPSSAIFGWLSGYSDDPQNPLAAYPPGTPESQKILKRKKLFDFDSSRISNAMFTPPGKPNSPYIYIDSANYDLITNAGGFAALGNNYLPFKVGTTYSNPDSFQILCAGRDEKFGNDDDMSNFWPGTRKDYLDNLK